MQVVTFRLGNLLCGLDIREIQEVLRQQELTPVPLAGQITPGLIHLRGQILTAIDLRPLLEMPPRNASARALSVILRSEDSPVSLIVDSMGDVVELPEGSCEPVPVNWQGTARELIHAVCQLRGKLLLILDSSAIHRAAGEDSRELELREIGNAI